VALQLLVCSRLSAGLDQDEQGLPRTSCWPSRSRIRPTSRPARPTSTATPTTRCSA
jgi:hypothetical protein